MGYSSLEFKSAIESKQLEIRAKVKWQLKFRKGN